MPAAHTRLKHAHELWHRALAAYPDPDDFVLNLHSLVMTLRQATWMVQKQKAHIEGYDAWYTSWEVRMAADPVMRWLKEARTQIEHRGDLELLSTARVTVISNWQERPLIEFEVPPMMGPDDVIANHPELEAFPDSVRRDGVLRVERRWVAADLPEHELLDACAYGYGVVATIIAEAHERLGFRMRTFGGETHEGRHDRDVHLGGRLPCMVVTHDSRTAELELATGEVISFERTEGTLDPDRDGPLLAEQAEAMLLAPGGTVPAPGEDLLDVGGRWASVARRVFAHDGKHVPMAILLSADGSPLRIVELRFETHAGKQLAVRRIADEIALTGAQAAVLINEIWTASVPIRAIRSDMPPVAELPGRGEALYVQVVTADGRLRGHCSPITRDAKGRPVLGKQRVEAGSLNTIVRLFPIFEVWRSWRRRAESNDATPAAEDAHAS